MGAESTRIIEFFAAVFSNWVLLLGGTIMIVLGTLERIFRKEVHWKLYTAIVVPLLFIAFYMSWRDMRIALDAKPQPSQQFAVIQKDPETLADITALRSENERLKSELNALNPLQQPISAVSAQAQVLIKLDQTLNTHDFSTGARVAIVKESEALLFLSVPDSYQKTTEPGTAAFVAVFNMPPYGPLLARPINELSMAEYIQLEFVGPSMPQNALVAGGEVVFIINGGQRFEFPIPEQTADGGKIFVRDLSPLRKRLIPDKATSQH